MDQNCDWCRSEGRITLHLCWGCQKELVERVERLEQTVEASQADLERRRSAARRAGRLGGKATAARRGLSATKAPG